MINIRVQHQPGAAELDARGVFDWPVWEKGVSSFPWHYDCEEICYVLEGDVLVTPEGGDPVHIKAGDFVTFPAGMSCHWDIREPIRKHYLFP